MTLTTCCARTEPTRIVTTSRSIVKHPRLRDHLPLRPDLRVDLAGPPLPVLLCARLLVPPQRVDVHDRERPVAFGRDDDLLDLAPVVDQGVGLEQLLPPVPPALRVETTPHHDPRHRIVRLCSGWPGPDHGRMKAGDEELRVLGIPCPGFATDDVADLIV